ncbi:MAG TPA: hypothetical protein VJX73_04625 [Terracidiphilus sp.]|nr:hypothetical protein [Terracidiphilus sp.]
MMSSNSPTLGDVYDLLTHPDFSDPQSDVVEEMGNLGGAARSAAGLISQLERETLGSVLSKRDGPEINRNTGRESGLQIILNEGGDPFLLRRTSYRKMFKPGAYDPDPYEPAQDGTLKQAFRRFVGLLRAVSLR